MGAVKPFAGAIIAPSSFDDSSAPRDPPRQGLHLEWAYGFRAFDSKSNLVSNSRGELVYPVAGIVVVLDPKARSQRFFLGHTDDVRCLAACEAPDMRDWMVSGQNATLDARGRSTSPHVCVWDSSDPEGGECFTLPLPAGSRAVRTVAFSPCGHFIAAAANDDQHTVSIWDWRARKQLAEAKGGPNAILQIKFSPTNSGHSYELFSVGVKHAQVWQWEKGSASLKGKRVALSAGGFALQTWNCVTFTSTGSALIGGNDGTMLLVKAGSGAASKSYPSTAAGAKASKVWSLCSYDGGVVAGLSNHSVTVFDNKLSPLKSFSFDFGVTAVWASHDSKDLLVGTQGGQVYEMTGALDAEVQGGSVQGRFKPLSHGHMDGELWAAAQSPDGRRAWTAGEDNQLLAWDLQSHELLARTVISDKKARAPLVRKAATSSTCPPNQCARALELSPDGHHLAMGTNDGALTVLDAESLARVVHVDLNSYGQRQVIGQQGNWIQAMAFSPSGHLLAVGTHGSAIVLLSPARGYKVVASITSHHSFISTLDWSADGETLRSNCGAYELLFHSVDAEAGGSVTARQITSASAVRDVQWATQHCPISWGSLGVVPESDGSFVNGVCLSPDGTLLASARDDGRVALYRYPAPAHHASQCRLYRGHSSHVTAARFSRDGRRLLSTGGHDLALLSWTVDEEQRQGEQGRTHTIEG